MIETYSNVNARMVRTVHTMVSSMRRGNKDILTLLKFYLKFVYMFIIRVIYARISVKRKWKICIIGWSRVEIS